MNCCDHCGCLPERLTSLDGVTLLCSGCREALLRQKESILNNPPQLSSSMNLVWRYLFQDHEPFHIEEKRVVFYGTRCLLDVYSALVDWSKLPQDLIPEGILDFGLPTDSCAIDGLPLHTSFCVYALEDSMISVEEYGSWVKVQLWPHHAT